MVGRILEHSKYFVHEDWLDISNTLVFDEVAYPDLYNALYKTDWSTITFEQQIDNSDPDETSDQMGNSVSIYGDTLVAGKPSTTGGAGDAGAIEIYTRSGTTWTLEQLITNPTPVTYDQFGYSVAIYQNTIVVGARRVEVSATSSAGEVYIYTRSGTTWTLEQTISNPSPAASDYFGHSVDIFDNTIVIGEPYDDDGFTAAGSVHIYTRSGTTWTLEQEINNPNGAGNDYFGWDVSLYQDTLAIGSQYGVNDDGTVEVYTRSGTTWTKEQTINNPAPADFDYFGNSVSVHMNRLVIGAPINNTGVVGAGSAYVYTRSGTTWTLEQTIDNPSGVINDYFGWDVSIYDDVIAIGCQKEDTTGTDAGTTYIYTRAGSTWTLDETINNPTDNGGLFGTSVAIDQDSLVIGSPFADITLSGSGSVYVYTSDTSLSNTINAKITTNPDTKYFVKVK